MDLKEAKELLKEGIVNSVGNKKTGMAESCKEYQEAIETILQELDNLQKENRGKDCIIATLDHNEEVKDEYIKHLEEKLDNLQKENEELKGKIIEVEKENLVQKAVIYEECISKDKIREKIEEYREQYKNESENYVRNRIADRLLALDDLLRIY